jgi:hypothetical protein
MSLLGWQSEKVYSSMWLDRLWRVTTTETPAPFHAITKDADPAVKRLDKIQTGSAPHALLGTRGRWRRRYWMRAIVFGNEIFRDVQSGRDIYYRNTVYIN